MALPSVLNYFHLEDSPKPLTAAKLSLPNLTWFGHTLETLQMPLLHSVLCTNLPSTPISPPECVPCKQPHTTSNQDWLPGTSSDVPCTRKHSGFMITLIMIACLLALYQAGFSVLFYIIVFNH